MYNSQRFSGARNSQSLNQRGEVGNNGWRKQPNVSFLGRSGHNNHQFNSTSKILPTRHGTQQVALPQNSYASDRNIPSKHGHQEMSQSRISASMRNTRSQPHQHATANGRFLTNGQHLHSRVGPNGQMHGNESQRMTQYSTQNDNVRDGGGHNNIISPQMIANPPIQARHSSSDQPQSPPALSHNEMSFTSSPPIIGPPAPPIWRNHQEDYRDEQSYIDQHSIQSYPVNKPSSSHYHSGFHSSNRSYAR